MEKKYEYAIIREFYNEDYDASETIELDKWGQRGFKVKHQVRRKEEYSDCVYFLMEKEIVINSDQDVETLLAYKDSKIKELETRVENLTKLLMSEVK